MAAGLAATIALDLRVWSEPSVSTTTAPASRAMMTPAAKSQALLESAIAASVRPSASQARSAAADPSMRTRSTEVASWRVRANRSTFLRGASSPTA